MFRSEDMCLAQLMFAQESMWDTMNYLAYTEKAMFASPSHLKMTANNSMALYANKMIKRTEDLLHAASEIQARMHEFEWPISEYRKDPKEYMRDIDKYCHNNNIEGSKLYEGIETEVMRKHSLLTEYTNNFSRIVEQRETLLYKKMCLSVMDDLVPFDLNNMCDENSRFEISGESRAIRGDKKVHAILGFIPSENLFKLQKLLFRISRENIILKSKSLEDIKDPVLKNRTHLPQKTLVFILFPRTEREVIIQKVDTMLKNFDFVNLDASTGGNKLDVAAQYNEELEDNRKIILKTQREINTILEEFSRPKLINRLSFINVIKLIIQREKNFAQHLIYIEEKDGFYQLLIWIPISCLEKLHNELEEIRMSDPLFTKPKLVEVGIGHKLGPKYMPPTYFHHNNFTKPFQMVVDTYGVPRYKEINPGLFTMVTFPFLFGIMFGDIGHGLMLASAALFIILTLDNTTSMLHTVKYLLLLLGLFSIYCGIVYNEFFSVPFIAFDSCYIPTIQSAEPLERRYENCTYPIGFDWIWMQTSNETTFINSFKMKFAIIIGVIQMVFGLFLKGLNAFYFSRSIDFWFEALPQMIFMLVIFGYMSFAIILKWLINWEGRNPISIIQMFISFTSVEEALFATPRTQEIIQTIFLSIAIACILLMLIFKPLIEYRMAKKYSGNISVISDENDPRAEHNANLSVS